MEKNITLNIENLPEGGCQATSNDIQGLAVQGRTVEETVGRAKNVVRRLLEAQWEKSHKQGVKINLCGGPEKIQGYVNVDIRSDADIVLDLDKERLPFHDDSVDVVVCFSAVNYFTRQRGMEIVRDVCRVLKPGGIARFAVQDLRVFAEKYVDRDMEFYFQKTPDGRDRYVGKTLADKLNSLFYGYPTFEDRCGKYVYDFESLKAVFEEAGFSLIEERTYRESGIPEIALIDNRPDQSFFLEAIKNRPSVAVSTNEGNPSSGRIDTIVTPEKKELVANINKLPFSDLKNLSRANPIIPFYHVVSNEGIPHIKHLYTYRNVKQFRDDLDFFIENYSPISLSDLLDSLDHKRSLPEKSFLLTFDDGLREVYDVIVPILKEKRLPATFFLNNAFLDNKTLFYRHKVSILSDVFQKTDGTGHEERIRDVFIRNRIGYSDFKTSILSINETQKHMADEIASILGVDFDNYLEKRRPYLTTDQVEALIKDGFAIGAHSMDHPNYSQLSFEKQLSQTRDSTQRIKERFSLDYGAFAFPYNDIGISKKYFEEVFAKAYVDISFGTSGMIKDTYPKNLQRFCMDSTLLSAQEEVANLYKSELAGIIYDRDIIERI